MLTACVQGVPYVVCRVCHVRACVRACACCVRRNVRQEMSRRSALSLRLRSTVSRDTEVPMPATMAAGMVACTGSAGKAAMRANRVERSPSEQPTRHRSVLTPALRQCGGDRQNAKEVGGGGGDG